MGINILKGFSLKKFIINSLKGGSFFYLGIIIGGDWLLKPDKVGYFMKEAFLKGLSLIAIGALTTVSIVSAESELEKVMKEKGA